MLQGEAFLRAHLAATGATGEVAAVGDGAPAPQADGTSVGVHSSGAAASPPPPSTSEHGAEVPRGASADSSQQPEPAAAG
ncbi:hypothetical protein EON67_07750 [archaeon]|nr:MAG: hypothetical protein EON67_07750 [archaeon]